MAMLDLQELLLDEQADVVIHEKAGEVLPRLIALL